MSLVVVICNVMVEVVSRDSRDSVEVIRDVMVEGASTAVTSLSRRHSNFLIMTSLSRRYSNFLIMASLPPSTMTSLPLTIMPLPFYNDVSTYTMTSQIPLL